MTNRTLTALAIRFAALLLFMKIFDLFNTYFFSLYYTAVLPLFQDQVHTPLDKFYYNGTFLLITNILISVVLFFKADRISTKLIKEDNHINIGLTPETLIKSILLSTGIIWLANSIFLLPDLYEYIQWAIAKVNHEELNYSKRDFSPIHYILKASIALLFIFRTNKVSLYLGKKATQREPEK